MLHYIEAPDGTPARSPSVFLAGGITHCPDWQSETLARLRQRARKPITVYNPRRANFDVADPLNERRQITWEFWRLHNADTLAFWFSEGSLNPIVLFEFGSALERREKITVGISPSYVRRSDVEIQMELRRPDLIPAYALDAFADGIIKNLDA